MPTQVKIVADSINTSEKRVTTFELYFPRTLLAELNTHRMFSRSTQSNRAVPFDKLLEQLKNDPYIPSHWGKNQSGMSANEELDDYTKEDCHLQWLAARDQAIFYAQSLSNLGLHKQIVNRLLEPWQYVYTVLTSTEWDNWYALRTDKNAHPDIQVLANKMLEVHNESRPHLLKENKWHLPYVTEEEKEKYSIEDCLKFSVARCARVSYKNHDKSNPDPRKDIELYDRLIESKHMSPTEHQAKPMIYGYGEYREKGITHIDITHNFWSGNFQGFLQYRQMLKNNVYTSFERLKK